MVRDEVLRAQIGFVSRRRGERCQKGLERLGNTLAHSQDIVALDWEVILGLTEYLENVIDALVGINQT